MSLSTMKFILDFVVNVYRQSCAVQPIGTPLPQQADMKHRVNIMQGSMQQQIKFISHLTNSLLHYKWFYVSTFELMQTCEVQVACAQ